MRLEGEQPLTPKDNTFFQPQRGFHFKGTRFIIPFLDYLLLFLLVTPQGAFFGLSPLERIENFLLRWQRPSILWVHQEVHQKYEDFHCECPRLSKYRLYHTYTHTHTHISTHWMALRNQWFRSHIWGIMSILYYHLGLEKLFLVWVREIRIENMPSFSEKASPFQ